MKQEIQRTRHAVFLDRDGVLNRGFIREGKSYPPRSMAEFELLPGVKEACQVLSAAGFLLVVVTNQPDVGRGQQQQAVVEEMHAYLLKTLPLDAISVCYHDTDVHRFKPATGMLLEAAQNLDLSLSHSFMVGDRWRDIDCGTAAGCRTILVEYPYAESLRCQPEFRVGSLLEASRLILDMTGPPNPNIPAD